MIWEELKDTLILPGIEAASVEDVMKTVGGTLIEQGFGKESYIDALMEREAEYPTGLNVDGVGIAIPHTSVEHVNKTAIAIASLKSPVTFEEMGMPEGETVDVSLVFMLCVTDPTAHLTDLQRIIAIVQDKSVLERLLEATSAQDVIDTIKEKELSL